MWNCVLLVSFLKNHQNVIKFIKYHIPTKNANKLSKLIKSLYEDNLKSSHENDKVNIDYVETWILRVVSRVTTHK